MSDFTPSEFALEAVCALAASRPTGRGLVVGSGGWLEWAQRAFPSAIGCEITDPAGEEGCDLLVITEGLEEGSLADVAQRLASFGSQLTIGGLGLFAVRPMAHAVNANDGATPVGPFDALLFPHAAKMGDLGETVRRRAMLSPLSWRNMVQRAGFSVLEASTGKPDSREAALRQRHAARLACFDEEALHSGALMFLVTLAEARDDAA